MFKIFLDDRILYDPVDPDKKILDPGVDLAVNSVGSASFKILPTHPNYSAFTRMRSIITVVDNGRTIFKGRVYGESVDFRKTKKIEAEGILAYLSDTIVRPYSYSGSVSGLLTYYIDQHNNQVSDTQRFKLGTVTVTDPNDYITRSSTTTPTTWKEINDKLVKYLGGYIVIRYESDGNYIDYLADYTDTSTQEIRYALNLLDLSTAGKSDKLATCIIPYGHTDDETGETLDITSVNGGIDYISDPDAVALYGKIYEVVTWDDVTVASNLLSKARLYLSDRVKLTKTITVKAIDLHLTGDGSEAFKLGDKVRVYSDPHGIDETALITAYKVNLSDPANSTITLGMEKESYLEQSKKQTETRVDEVKKEVGDMVSQKTGTILSESRKYTNNSIETSEEATREILRDYVLTTDLDTYKESVSSQFTQTADGFDMRFKKIDERVTNETAETVRRVESIEKYIRYVDGSIILGEIGSKLTTKISNGRISFLYNDNLEVAYISDNKLYITRAEILESIIIGSYAFIPRTNGNLSFKKV